MENADLFASELAGKEEGTEDEIESLLSMISDEFGYEPSSALDVGCGLGRHCHELAEKGIETTGIDISPEYLQRAREKAHEAGIGDRVHFQELDMRNL